MKSSPYLIKFPKFGVPATGYISVAEKDNLPFVPKRIYWTYYTPEDVERGGHSHINLQQVLVAVSGTIFLDIETVSGEKFRFILDSPNKGVYIPRGAWRTMKYTHNAVQMCIANIEYDESDYIRNYEDFKNLVL
jgi:hypothetical protein